MTKQRRSLAEEFRQSWLTVVIVALSSALLGWGTGFSYLQLRFAGVSGAPDETVTHYLQAIAANDSLRALAELAHRPEDGSLLTDEVLRAAHVEHPMTDIRVTDTNSARVPAKFRLGDEQIEITIPVTVVDGEFKVDAGGFATADLKQARSLGVPVLLGSRPTMSDTPALFPGIYPVTSGNPRFTLDPIEPLRAITPGATAQLPELRLAITSTGTTALQAAVRTSLTGCSQQQVTEPAGCPFRFDAAGQSLKPGSQRWVNLTDAGERFTVTGVDMGTATATVAGRVRFSAIRLVSGREEPFSIEVPFTGSATLDLLDESAAIKWRT